MKHALITGATKGIGRAVAEDLLQAGYYVILNYANDDESANQLHQELNTTYPDQSCLLKHDVGAIEGIASFVEKAKAITATLDVLIFNTGKTDRASLEEMTYEGWKDVFDTNLTVPFFLIQQLLPNIVAGGSILFTGSSMGVYPHSFSISYGVSKAAVHALVANLVKFLAPKQIRINAVVPGFVDTEWQKSKPAELRERIEQKIALNRFCSPAEVSQACLFLIHNTYMNGAMLNIDGGYNFK